MHPLLEFKIHAVQNNEIFFMVADLIATAVSLRRQQIEQNLKNNNDSTYISDKNNLQESMAPYLDFTMVPWSEVATAPLMNDPENMTECIELKEALYEMCDLSSTLLKRALSANAFLRQGDDLFEISLNKALAEFESMFGINEGFFGRVIGSFEQNAMGVRARHPLCRDILEDEEFRVRMHMNILSCLELAGMISDDDEAEGGRVDTSEIQTEQDSRDDFKSEAQEYSPDDIAEFIARLYIDEEGLVAAPSEKENDDSSGVNREEDLAETGDSLDALFVPLDGTCMYSTACKMNHSCEPNVLVRYRYSCSGGGKFSRW